jgi:predicted PhzF superfamily epimerase YddE/YHI9
MPSRDAFRARSTASLPWGSRAHRKLFASGRYLAAQGTRLGRSGRIHVSQDADGQVWVAGTTRTLFGGRIV